LAGSWPDRVSALRIIATAVPTVESVYLGGAHSLKYLLQVHVRKVINLFDSIRFIDEIRSKHRGNRQLVDDINVSTVKVMADVLRFWWV
jgi:hypothetical protein